MTEEKTVPFDDNVSDNAILLLAAAEELGLGPAAVKTTEGSFLVPQEVYDKAFQSEKKKAPAKKAAKKKVE